jgi:TonB family protein
VLLTPAAARAQIEDAPGVTAPEVVERSEVIYPDDADGEGTALLLLTIERDGSVSKVEIVESAGAKLDEAAVAAVRSWRFVPAKRGDRAVRSKIRVAVPIAPPTFDAPRVPKPAQRARTAAAGKPAAEPAARGAEAPIEVEVEGARAERDEDRGASHFEVQRDVLEAAPTQEGADVLRRAPGLYIGRQEGAAIAHSYMLRGFDADHGQDIEFRVGGLPINQRSHIHGQGYADLGFVIGEAVHALEVTEGVYDPRQGDFAVAGTIDIELGAERRGWLVKSQYGAFHTFRQLAMWAPEGESRETFGAVHYSRSDGYGDNRKGAAASAMFQARFGSPGAWSYRALGFVHGARANLAGVVRSDDVESGRVDFYGVYPYPTARNQNAVATRVMGGAFADYHGKSGASGELGVWLGYDNFRSQTNFTGFIHRSRALAGVAGRGDLIEQQNRATSGGIVASYRTRTYEPADWTRGTLELGFDGRVDDIDQAQNLLDATVRNQTWDERVAADIVGGDIGLFADLDWSFPHVRARLGLRGDALFYSVDDHLGNFAPDFRPEDAFIVGFRRSAFGVAAGPRTSVEVLPLPWLSLRAAYGEGYRSPQARTLEDGEEAPFTKVRSADVGTKLSWDERLTITLAGYFTHLSDDVAFEASEGRLERIGASRRLGAVLHMETRPLPWLVGAASITVVDAVLLEPPPPTAENPQPAFVEGQNLPFVPPVVGRVDLGARHSFVDDLGGRDLRGRLGAGLSYLSPRPLPFGDFSSPVALLDAGAGVGWGPIEAGIDVFNILNVEYAAIELNFPSDWDPEGPRRRVPARHTAAGPPITWMVSLEVAL